MSSPVAQTNLQLHRQLAAAGMHLPELRAIRETYELAVSLFGTLFRASGKPFVAHLVGTASIIARDRPPLHVLQAALLHAAYVQGVFGDGPPGRTRRRAKRLAETIGEEGELLVARYSTFPWTAADPLEPELLRSLDPSLRAVVQIRLANEVEEFADGDVLAHANGSARAEKVLGAIPAWTRDALEIGAPELAAAVEGLGLAIRGDVPPELRSRRFHSFHTAPPLSHTLGSRCRAALRIVRAAARAIVGSRPPVRPRGGGEAPPA